MRRSVLLQRLRKEQRDEAMKKTAAERLLLALELSDSCIQLNCAARQAIEEKRAIRATQPGS